MQWTPKTNCRKISASQIRAKTYEEALTKTQWLLFTKAYLDCFSCKRVILFVVGLDAPGSLLGVLIEDELLLACVSKVLSCQTTNHHQGEYRTYSYGVNIVVILT